MKKKYILITILVVLFLALIISTILILKDKNNRDKLNAHTYNLKFEYYQKVTFKDAINVNVDDELDTTELGHFVRETIINNEKYIIEYDVIDTTPPLIIGGNSKTVEVGKKVNLVNKFLCGDNHDDVPKCTIEGDYDLNKVGKYKLTYKATDSSGNTSTKKFTLKVIEKKDDSNGSTTIKKTPISKYIKKYKNENTMIGIDVSTWQGEIDYEKVKNDGVEFVIIRIGFGHTNSGEIKLDNQFKNNIKNAKEAGLKVGLYLYSYAENEEQAIEQANWIVDKLDGEKLDLPIAFDWEDWNSFNSYKMSFTKLNNSAQSFIDELERNGYEGMLYSSAYYLNHIWKDYKNIWLAYYTDNNDFNEKPFMLWQLTSSGKVNGIDGAVDIDVLYK